MNRTITLSVRHILIGVAALAALVLAGCGASTPSGQQQENQDQQSIETQLVRNQPIPNIPYSQMRQNLIEIETAQAKGVQTTTFFFNQGVQDPVRTCPSIGVPIASTSSLSNPSQIAGGYAGGGGNYGIGVIDQMDPNGVYAPKDSLGTYVICVDGNGSPVATYWEGFVETEFGPAVWDQASHTIKPTGPATFHFSTKQGG